MTKEIIRKLINYSDKRDEINKMNEEYYEFIKTDEKLKGIVKNHRKIMNGS